MPTSSDTITARFLEPMLLLATDRLPEGEDWQYELKFDGYRAIGFKSNGRVQLRSRNDKDFTQRYGAIANALEKLPNNTVIDGEVVAFDESGHPSFNSLQNFGSTHGEVYLYIFDLLVLAGRDVRTESLDVRRDLLEKKVLSKLEEPIRRSPALHASLSDLIASVKEQGFEGLVAKRCSSVYESGQRSGAWLKMRVNKGQEFVVGGYTIGGSTFDALIFGYYERNSLIYASRTRNGFTPVLREKLFKQFRGLAIERCPFANLPEEKSGRWGVGLTAAKMKDCRWLKPKLVGQFEFAEWTPDNHLRHSRFVALREDKDPKSVRKEQMRL
jgi:DNA ligase D-like protein (predicted ligase)